MSGAASDPRSPRSRVDSADSAASETSSAELALDVRGLRRSVRTGFFRRRLEVLAGVDLELARGCTLGLLGPNGSGKTSLLRVVAGIDPPTGGEVLVWGSAPDSANAARRRGYLPEDSPFPPELSASAALDLLGSLQGMPRRERRARAGELLERVGLAAHARRPLARYSRGMLRRFGLAQAYLHRPELVLLDEPTAGLDAPGFGVLAELLEESARAGAATVLCSHLPTDLLRHADEVAVMLDGRIAERCTPGDLAREDLAARYRRLAAAAPDRDAGA